MGQIAYMRYGFYASVCVIDPLLSSPHPQQPTKPIRRQPTQQPVEMEKVRGVRTSTIKAGRAWSKRSH